MKSILLTSTALVAFAGAAMAESHEMAASGVTWGADGEFGYNEEVEGGFYFDGGLAVTTNAGMNMGLTAGLALDVDLGFNAAGTDAISGPGGAGTFSDITINGSDFVIFVEGQGAALYIGDTETGAETQWSGFANMGQDSFIEVDDVNDGRDNGDFVDGVIRGDMNYGPVSASLSYLMTKAGDNSDLNGLDGLSLGANATFGSFNLGMAYQEEINRNLINFVPGNEGVDGVAGTNDDVSDTPGTANEIIAVSAGTTFGGADVKIGYANNITKNEDSIGLQAAYTVGAITGTAFYSFESAYDDNYGIALDYAGGPATVHVHYHDGTDQEIALEASYDAGMGIMAYAGYIENDGDKDAYEAYVAATYDLGGGASLIASYGDAGDNYTGATDEIGDRFETNLGTTVAVSFTF